MIDVAVAIDGEARNVTLTTQAAGTYSENGEFAAGSATTTTIRAAIFPLSNYGTLGNGGDQLKDAPEGIRTEAGWLCWSRSSIKVDDQIIDGVIAYRVLFVWPRPEGGFTRAALGRKTP